MNNRQEFALRMMSERPDRALYEGSAPPRAYHGSGKYWLTYSAGIKYEPLTQADVDSLSSSGHIVQMWPGCYRLASQLVPDHASERGAA